MDVAIVPFDVASADQIALEQFYQLRAAVAAVDRPDEPPLTYETAVGQLLSPLDGQQAALHWAARRDGRMLGFGVAVFPDHENEHLARVNVLVSPDARRHGIGTALLRAALPAARENDRRAVAGAVLKDAPGDAWARALGFRAVLETVLQELSLATADRSGWLVEPPAGYELRRWVGGVPGELLASYVIARTAISDAPLGQYTERTPEWTPERIRAAEDDLRQRQVEEWVVAAVHQATGAVAGVTMITLYPHQPDTGYQGDTVVLAEHRGHGLGLALKTAMLRWLPAQRPQLTRVRTSSAADNVHMLRINRAVGYAVYRGVVVVEQAVDRLRLDAAHG